MRGCDRVGVHGHAESMRRARPAPGSHLRLRRRHCSALRVPLAATRRDGALSNGLRPLRAHWGKETPAVAKRPLRVHFVVGSPCNIDILLRAILLELHPTSPPSHMCLSLR